MIIVELSWPSSRLTSNNTIGKSWQATRAARDDYKKEAFCATLDAMQAEHYPSDARYQLTITFLGPDRRARDLDNLFFALKSALDGIAAAMKINDKQFVECHLRHGKPVKGGKVIVKVEQKRKRAKRKAGRPGVNRPGDPDLGDVADQD